MDNHIKEALLSFLEGIETRARADALAGHSDIGSIFGDAPDLQMIDPKQVQDVIAAINQATSTKEAARRIVNAILVAAKIAADEFIK